MLSGSADGGRARPAAPLVWVYLGLMLFLSGCAASAVRPVPLPLGLADVAVGRGTVPAAIMIEPGTGVRPLIRAIDRAQFRIFLEMYILSDARVVRALERAAAQSVDVYVLLEHHPYGLPTQPLSIAQRLAASGVHVRWSRPGFTFTHAKLIVLDDRLAILSTANFSRSAFTHNREVLVFDRSRRDVRELSELFRADWDRLPLHVSDANLVLAPESARTKLSRFLMRAHRSIDIYAEEVADASVEQELGGLVHAHVRVRVMLPPGPSPGIAILRARGVMVRQVQIPYIHAKVIVIDETEAFVGSENLSTTSLDRNREVGVFVRGSTVRRLIGLFDRDWKENG